MKSKPLIDQMVVSELANSYREAATKERPKNPMRAEWMDGFAAGVEYALGRLAKDISPTPTANGGGK